VISISMVSIPPILISLFDILILIPLILIWYYWYRYPWYRYHWYLCDINGFDTSILIALFDSLILIPLILMWYLIVWYQYHCYSMGVKLKKEFQLLVLLYWIYFWITSKLNFCFRTTLFLLQICYKNLELKKQLWLI
jgi:hypothetical protein